MKKSKLKPLIKQVLRELYSKRLNESTGTLDEYEIEFESLVITGISTEDNSVIMLANIDYDAEPGAPDKGMFGRPEDSQQGYGAEVNITDITVTSLVVKNQQNQIISEIYNLSKLSPEQQKEIHKAVEDYVSENEDSIKNKILDLEGSHEPDYSED